MTTIIIKYVLPLQYHSICESNFAPCCSQPCTALRLLWSSTRCPLEGWNIATCDLSAPAVGKEIGWARLHVPSALLSCGSPDSPRKESIVTKQSFCVCSHRIPEGKGRGKRLFQGRDYSVPQLEEKRGGSCCTLLQLEEMFVESPLGLNYLGMKVTKGRGEESKRPLPTTSGTPLASYPKSLTVL